MELLTLFFTNSRLNLNEMVQLSGIPKTSIHRMVGSLEDMGFLQKNELGQYSLGLLFLQLGQLVKERLDIRDVALPIMKNLRDDVGEAVNLIIKDENEAIYIEKVDTLHPVRLYTKIGRRSPMYAGACSRILLSFLSDYEREEYIKEIELRPIASGTITDKEKLRNVLEESRKNKYTVSFSELENYTAALAAPIFDEVGNVMAGISVAGPEQRFQDERLPELVEKVKKAANEISEKLGWRDSVKVVI